MREFLLSVIGVVVISLIVEVIFPAKRMKGAVGLAFSLAVIFILVGGIKNLINDKEFNFPEIEILTQDEEFLNTTITETERQLKSHLSSEGYQVRDIKLISKENASLEFDGVEVIISGEVDEEKLKDKIIEIIAVERENIWVRN